MQKSFIVFIFIGLALISALFVQHQSQKQQTAQTTTKVLLPHFSLPDVTGVEQPISNWQGNILIINFWATWCPPCLDEIPGFIELQKEYTDKNVQFIGIAIDKTDLVVDYLKTLNINYPILVAEENAEELVVQLGNFMKVVPYTLIVNPSNQIIYQHPGDLTKKELREQIEPLIPLN
ncbi:MAG: redoxin domain-containing protein [Methyloprofundus sp.]|nr:redoxin domain-containing protein [Methyloprofundus sp.]